ncbi:hypothetical protein MLD38_006722 [Melastoma candidum]|uniref:Uncharacterized protein n=1 Tax=Melastoma candidum TaxID=119954 RepID=A0ACB9RNX9_9MYRT|nr:hypothetical protein MLD38_006722 [Melastoma candidum]
MGSAMITVVLTVAATITIAAASSSECMSSGECQGSFNVFISFRGKDVRNTFLSHLLQALEHAGIRAYVDTTGLSKGDDIAQSLGEAIRNSRIAIPIFSLNYASSRWCLNELVQIMDCRKRGQLVMPVFYRVEPWEVRRPTTYSLEKALASHGNDSEVLTRWMKALSDASHLSGWHLDANG